MGNSLAEILTVAVKQLVSFEERLDQLEAEASQLRERVRILEARETAEQQSSKLKADQPLIECAEAPSPAAVTLAGSTPESVSVSRDETPRTTPRRWEVIQLFGGTSSSEADLAPVAGPVRPFVKSFPATIDELPWVEQRCRLKAEACRWAVERRQLLLSQVEFRTEVEPRDRDLIARAKSLPDCFLWMSHSSAPAPSDPAAWQVLAGCFDALAQAIHALVGDSVEQNAVDESFTRGVELLAEAQSALRVAIARIQGPTTDHDQARVFGWLKQVASEQQLFIRRYMRLDDPADPSRWMDLTARITQFAEQGEHNRRKVASRRKALGRIRYKLSQLPADNSADPAIWSAIGEEVHQLVAEGLPPSNVELRQLLVEYADKFPELAGMPQGFLLTVREIDRYLATQPSVNDVIAESNDVTAPVVAEVADMLEGKTVVLIGGDRRNHAAEALKRAFRLEELVWVDTRAHESVSGFQPYVARPEVAMVLLAIRWSSHSFGEVQDFCRDYNKPLVRLPGGYNPNQVAQQILEQCSSRLASV